jgi:hypothetical protein
MRLDALPPFDGPAQDPDGEPWETLSEAPDARHRPVTLSGGNARGSDLVWTQKSCIARWIWAGRDAPVLVVGSYAAPSADALRAVLARHAPSRVLVVTDLDPWGWALAQHLLAHLAQLAPDLPVLHRGVGDALLALSDAWLPTDGGRDPLMRSMPLSASEVARWQWLRPRCADAMGTASRALLDAGYKREVEGATNPDCHRPGFTDALRRCLLAP